MSFSVENHQPYSSDPEKKGEIILTKMSLESGWSQNKRKKLSGAI